MKISGQAAIVTGGASGLGKAAAQALTEAGAKVLIIDLDTDAGKSVAEEIGGVFTRADIAREDDVADALAIGRDAHGPARIMINCAARPGGGIRTVGRKGPHPLDMFRDMVETNLIGSFNMCRMAAADMVGLDPLERGERGVLVTVSSVNALDGPVGTSAYTASKAGVAAMTITIARDLAPKGVRCCTIAPGNFETPMLHDAPQFFLDQLIKQVPFPNDAFGAPNDFADLALHICENIMLNGEVIRLDGAVRHAQHA